MTPEKQRRVATAVGFLSGLLACLDALRDASVYWPPEESWQALRHVQRLELGGGVALMVVTFVVSLVRRKET
ncbi:MAG: hypothetical protein WCB05_12800 [Candidatus Sulfotelmatobacter sp.]